MPKVFLSYRKADSAEITGWLAAALRKRLPDEDVFWDALSLRGGSLWPDELRRGVEQCDVLLAIIGKRWLSEPDEYHRRRIDQDGDWVRQEIALALACGRRVIPVLVSGAAPLDEKAGLKDDIAKLPQLQCVKLRSDGDFDRDAQALADLIDVAPAAAPIGATTRRTGAISDGATIPVIE